ncbi:MAG: hypothetical protein GY775_13985 [Candidatus Scalindua sp.]|nr:hypothetical protein [Candidatus Scalindua sp.]
MKLIIVCLCVLIILGSIFTRVSHADELAGLKAQQLATQEQLRTMQDVIKNQQEMINELKDSIESKVNVNHSYITNNEEDEIEQIVDTYLTEMETRENMVKPGSPPPFNVYWDSGLRFNSEDGNFKFKLGGRIMNDWGFMKENRTIKEDTGIGDLVDGTKFRRARLYLKGKIYENIEFEMEYDFTGGGGPEFKDVYMELKEIPYVGNLRIGQFKSPFCLEYLTTSKYDTFMERGLNTELAPRRNTGFMLYDQALDERMTWAANIYRTADDFGDSQGDSTTEGCYSFAGRITGLPWYKNNGEKYIHTGFSYNYQNAFENKLIFGSEPETDFTEKFVSTGDISAESAHLYNPELALVFGPFSLQTEYTYVHVNSTGNFSGQDPDFTGFYVFGSYFLTGEHRRYDKKEGETDRVRPKSNFNWGKGLGAIEVAARYSELDLSDKYVDGGRLNDTTLGLNWYLNPNTRVMLNYVHAGLDLSDLNIKNANADIASIRFQIDF